VPDHAIVNESVELTRAVGQARASGFVNAVLRNLIRGRRRQGTLPSRPAVPEADDAALDYLSVALSHPRWLVARWLSRFGFDACERWCLFNNAPPNVTLRPVGVSVESLLERLEAAGLQATRGRFVGGAVEIGPGVLGRIPEDIREQVLVQDEASQLVALAAGASPGERVLDACAAPGGKTLILAAAIGSSGSAGGMLVAADRRLPRVRLLKSTLARTRGREPLVVLDAAAGLPFESAFDRVLLDAPCSGLGTIRRDPDIKWNRTESDLRRFAETQAAMLAHATRAVRPGGSLIYSTCSSEPEENEQVVDAFLASTTEFALAPLELKGECAGAGAILDERGRMRTWPFEHGLDAFFAARLVRRNAA
jgi:16S rRNA (cytosine967-C5)-methyltransferase